MQIPSEFRNVPFSPSPEDQDDLKRKRFEAWKPVFEPKNDFQEYQLGVAVDASVQFDNCRAYHKLRKDKLAKWALDGGYSWKAQNRDAACKLGRSLKKNPESIVLRLREIPAGRAWMLREWELLAIVVAEGSKHTWNDTMSNRALDLVGATRFNRDVFIASSDLFKTKESICNLIRVQIAKLKEEQEALDPTDDFELRQLQVEGMHFVDDEKLLLARRYEQNAYRRMNTALKAVNSPPVDKPASQVHQSYPEPAPVSTLPVDETKPIPSTRIDETKPIPDPGIEVERAPEVVSPAQVAPKPVLNRRTRRYLEKLERAKARQEARETRRDSV